MAIVPSEILLNLTTEAGQLPTSLYNASEYIAKWCYNQHFDFQYRAIWLIYVAFLFLFIYRFMADFDDKIPEYKIKLLKWEIDKYETRKFLFQFASELVLIFLLIFLYMKYDFHFLDWIFNMVGFI